MKNHLLLLSVGLVAKAVGLITILVFVVWFIINFYRFGVADVQQTFPQLLISCFIISFFVSNSISLTIDYMELRAFTLGQMFSISLWVGLLACWGGMVFATSLRPPFDPRDSLYISKGIDATIDANSDYSALKPLCYKRAQLAKDYKGFPWQPNPKCK